MGCLYGLESPSGVAPSASEWRQGAANLANQFRVPQVDLGGTTRKVEHVPRHFMVQARNMRFLLIHGHVVETMDTLPTLAGIGDLERTLTRNQFIPGQIPEVHAETEKLLEALLEDLGETVKSAIEVRLRIVEFFEELDFPLDLFRYDALQILLPLCFNVGFRPEEKWFAIKIDALDIPSLESIERGDLPDFWSPGY